MSNLEKARVELPSDHEVEVTRRFRAPRELVYEAYTNPKLVPRWLLGPPGWTMPVCEMDVRPGGKSLFVMRGPEGQEFPNPGVYLQVDPGRRLVATDAFTDAWTPSEKAFMVLEVRFDDEAGGTRYTAMAHHWTLEAKA